MFDKFRAVCRVSVEYSTNKLFTLNFRSSVTKVSCTGGRLDDVTKGTLIFRLLAVRTVIKGVSLLLLERGSRHLGSQLLKADFSSVCKHACNNEDNEDICK